MIKVGILDADSAVAGEIIRIMILHPETEIVSLLAPNLTGRTVSSFHHGLIGESPLVFTEKINPENLDFLIVPELSDLARSVVSQLKGYEDLKIAALSNTQIEDENLKEFVTGLSEINRKTLVRGARLAIIPSPAILPALIALGPLANFLLLNSDIYISVSLPQDLADKVNVKTEIEALHDEIMKRQTSFNNNISLNIAGTTNRRESVTEINMKNSLPLEEIEKIYDQIYDDHNFTFISRSDISPKEVEGTQKTIICLDKPDSFTLKIKVLSDARMRGGAGDVVHIMNLFFGLHEKTGLTFKSSVF